MLARKLKVLGWLLSAALALSISAVSAASAAEFWAEEEPAHIDVVSEGTHVFESAAGAVTCAEVVATANLTEESASLTAEEVQYQTCHVVTFGITFPVTVDMNSCSYLLTAGTRSAGGSEGSFHITCAEEEEIVFTVFNSDHETLRCEVHVPEQSFYTLEGTVTYSNTLSGFGMAITATAETVKITETVTDLNTLGCNSHAHDKATYNGSFLVSATTGEEEYIDSTVTGVL